MHVDVYLFWNYLLKRWTCLRCVLLAPLKKDKQAVMGVFTNRPYVSYQFYDITMPLRLLQFWSSFSQDSFGYSAVVPSKF